MKPTLLIIALLISSFCNAQVNLNSGLVLYLPFNGNTLDVSGNGNNAINNGATLTIGQSGIPNTAYSFNGTSDFMQIADNASINFNNSIYSIYALVKPQNFYTGTCHGNIIIDKNGDFNQGWYTLRFSDAYSSTFQNCSSPINTAQEIFEVHQNNQAGNGTSFAQYINLNNWYCVVSISDGININCYVNGVLSQTVSTSGLLGTNSADLFIGRLNSSIYPYWFNGIMDEVRIYNRVLNLQEIDSLCNFSSSNNIDSINSHFTFSFPIICDSTQVQFTDSSFTVNSSIVSWDWNFGDGISSTLQNPIHIYINSGIYTVTLIVTSNTNKKDTFFYQVNAKNNMPIVTATAFPSTTICQGSPIILTGNGAVTYTWSGGVSNNVPFVPTGNANYLVTGTDANGCSATSSIFVAITQGLQVSITNSEPTLCIGDSALLTASGGINYIWNPITGLNNSTSATVWAKPANPTTYTVTGSDANGCTGISTTNLSIISSIDVTASKSNDIECGKNTAKLLASGAQNYVWSPANYLNNPNSNSPTASINQTTTFLVIGNTGSCIDSTSVTVDFFNTDGGTIFIPTAFSPNFDNQNDCFQLKTTANFKEFYFTIYNRWGQKVFETNNPYFCWEGFYNNQEAPIGSYYYYLKAETNCGKIFKKGDVELIR